MAELYLEHLRGNLEKAEQASNDVRKALKGLVPEIWIEEYIAVRINAIRRMCELL